MATLSEGNGVAYHHYVGICPNQQAESNLGVTTNEVSDSKCEELTTSSNAERNSESETVQESSPVVDIVINNVVCSFNVRCHLNLREIALNAANVVYKRENGMVTMKIRNPYTTASIWSSGKVTCTGATSEDAAKKASRRFARAMQKLGFKARFANFRVVNVLGTCTMPFGIRILHFSQEHRRNSSYEPELHPGVTYRCKDLRATLKIFSTGSITITAPCVENVQRAVEHIFPLVYEFRKEKVSVPTVDKKAHINSIKDVKKMGQKQVSDDEDESDNLSDLNSDIRDSDSSWD